MSLWEKYRDDLKFPKLTEDLDVDVLIIGGGITGLTTLYNLKNYKSIALVEAREIGTGISMNTTGKVTFLQGTIYSDLEKNINKETAIKYLKSQRYAINLLKEIIEKEKIACDWEKVTSFVYADKKKDIKKLEREEKFLRDNGIKVFSNKELKMANISVQNTYVFNPMKYLNCLKRILRNKKIYENTKITKIISKDNGYCCYFENGKIIAKKVIVTCHYPFFIFPFFLPLKSHIEKSYLIAYRVQKNFKKTGITVSNPGFSYRFYQDNNNNNIYRIVLASSHVTAFKQNDEKNFKQVQVLFNIEKDEIAFQWSNIDIITDDKMPFISSVRKNLYVATGFNTWGMTNGVIAAKILSDNILNITNEYNSLFQNKRKNWYQIKNFFANTFISLWGFLASKKVDKSWYNNNLKFKTIKGKKVAVYKDKGNKKHIVYTTCPHLKCSLVFNELEKTWDCPCHSSRFSLEGKCIKGPSKYDISYKK